MGWVHSPHRGSYTPTTDSSLKRLAATFVISALVVSFVIINRDLVDDLQKQFPNSVFDILRLNYSRAELTSPDGSEEFVKLPQFQALLDDIKEAARVASGGMDFTLTPDEADEWRRKNPCMSRSELVPMYDARRSRVPGEKKLPNNPLWDKVLEEYSKLHRICMLRVGDAKDYFMKQNNSIPGCKFLVGEGTNGLGNKILVTVSATLYAILTQRILLMPSRVNLRPVLCEPFLGSSWRLDSSSFLPWWGFNNSWTDEHVFMKQTNAFLEEQQKSGKSFSLPPHALAYSAQVAAMWVPGLQQTSWFYCSTSQKVLSQIPWIYFSGCIYTIPKLFGSSPFRSTLEALFPDKMVLTQMLRSIILPTDTVWNRFKHLNRAYFPQANRRIGLQVRYFNGQGDFDKMSPIVTPRVLDCVLNKGILPKINDTWNIAKVKTSSRSPPAPSASKVTPLTEVFIASLYEALHDHINDYYLRGPTATGEDVSVVQITSKKHQSFGVEEDTEAFVEILLLSLSDELVITPGSTFGGLAHAYGAITPWLINLSEKSDLDPLESCVRAQTPDTCQQHAPLEYKCPYDSKLGVSHPSSDSPPSYLRQCMDVDREGIQLLSSFQLHPR